jgi:Nif-specific regulatory protein
MHSDAIELAAKINDALARSPDVQANIRAAAEIIRGEFAAEFVFVALDRGETEGLAVTTAVGIGPHDFRKLENRIEKSLIRKDIETGEPVFHENIADDEGLAFLGDLSLLTAPLKLGGLNLGIAAVGFEKQQTDQKSLAAFFPLAASMIAQTLRIERAVRGQRQKLLDENSHLRQELKGKYEFSHIVGNSGPMKQVYELVSQVARSNATVLLRGETGTGKEMIANAIHYNSLRAKGPFVKINCAALPESLIESELFGHEKGAFTGAEKMKKGRFELAAGGTLFLDEIGDLPPQTQIKLLRVLQEREFERVGGTETIKTNIRLVTATNKDLETAITTGEFREDLYYRLNVFTIHLAPLRERRSDILLLAEHFLEKYETEHDKRIRRISTPAIDMLMAYHYPGNVRELENAIERAVLVCDANAIHPHHLPPTLQTAELTGTEPNLSLAAAVEAFERGLIQDALKSTSGNVAKAAKMLDSTERIIGYKIRKYSIDAARFKL